MCEAIIDLGTNSALLTVARREASGIVVLADVCTLVRLGQGVDVARRLHSDAKARTMACVTEYVRLARALGAGRVTLVGTAVLRDAVDGEAFLAALVTAAQAEDVSFERESRSGGSDMALASVGRTECEVVGEIVSGEREAELSFAGALEGLPLAAGERVVVFDVGGGSSEVVIGPDARASLPVGAVRMTERCVKSDPPAAEELEAIAAETTACWARSGLAAPRDARLVAVAGTATTLAAIDLSLATYDGARVHGHALTLDRLAQMRDELAALALPARRAVPGLQPGRADVIVAGATILKTLVEIFGGGPLCVSDRGLRHGRLGERLAG